MIPWDLRNIYYINDAIDRNMEQWNNAAAWAIERFGLPGDKYTCRPTKAAMEFWFKDPKDAVVFQLRWS